MLLCVSVTLTTQAQSLDDCQTSAAQNYPVIRRYELIQQTTDMTVANLSKGWLPQVSAVAQATWQSDVMTLPDPLQNMLALQGFDVKGLKKDQYRIALDVSQTVYDGGLIAVQKEIARAQGDLQAAQADVDLYAVRQRVNDLYFGVLLLDEKLRLNHDLQTLLQSNFDKLEALHRGGVAMQSDVYAVRAECLRAEQQATELTSARQSLVRMLAVFTGQDNVTPIKPQPLTQISPVDDSSNRRPELSLFDRQLKLADAQERLLNVRLLPRLSVFAQGYYGYPGYDMFHDMFHHDLTLNGMVGARLTWNIGALYTRRSDKAKIQAQRGLAENARETFLFNNHLMQVQQSEGVEKYRRLMAEDSEIVALRQSVRKAAESKLAHGIIDTNNLLQEITRENQALIDWQTHEIQMLKELYDLKYTTNQ